MTGSSKIVPGCFRAAEIEPGTFHAAEIEPGTFHQPVRPPQVGLAARPTAASATISPQMRSASAGYLPVPTDEPLPAVNRTDA